MESKGAKIAVVIIMFAIFGGAIYWMYGPNSQHAAQNAATTERLKNYVKADGELVSSESNGRIGKGADRIYHVQFKVAETSDFKIAKFRGTDAGWSDTDKTEGSKFPVYYDPENPSIIVSEREYHEAGH